MIYFIRAVESNAVKIGHTTGDDANARLSSLQVGYPGRLDLLATMPGDMATERELHEQFAALSIRGEWFRYEGRLQELVAGLRESNGQTDDYGDRCWRMWSENSPEFMLGRVVETAFRRGWQQAIGAIADLIREAPHQSVLDILARAEDAAFQMRFDGKARKTYWPEFATRVRGKE